MSAWIVSKRHIDLLVAAIVRSELCPDAGIDRTAIGAQLWSENFESVNERYDEDESVPDYEFEAIELPDLDTLAGLAYVRKQFGCYSYQSCEHGAWTDSAAYRWTSTLSESLRQAMIAKGAIWQESWGFAEEDFAPWGIEDDYTCPDLSDVDLSSRFKRVG